MDLVRGPGDTIVRYPDLVESLVAAGRDPIASATNLAELRATHLPVRVPTVDATAPGRGWGSWRRRRW